MYLKRLILRNYRCHDDLELTDLPKLVVLVGENDAGKTCILQGIIDLLDHKASFSDSTLFSSSERERPTSYEIEGTFACEDGDTPPQRYIEESGSITLRRKFTKTTTTTLIRALTPKSPLFTNFETLQADAQKKALESIKIQPATNKAGRIEQYLSHPLICHSTPNASRKTA